MNLQAMNPSDFITTLTLTYKQIGPITAMLLCFMEAFLPFLPLSAFVMANSAAFGLIEGLLLSSLGSILGAWAVYGIFRFFGNRKCLRKYIEHRTVQTYMNRLEQHSFIIIGFLCMLPVFPNSVITTVAGITKMNFKKFAFASAFGITGLNTIFSLVGSDLHAFLHSPLKVLTVIAVFFSIHLIGTQMKNRMLSNS
ncbi:TVP38/TMEM64 family protein [Bacillus massiliigorillae]|uniref:TVP38/TMEM64 family protein n=1 Tax=Bacillus massiliigorillae TaxID=1243664 RepID=UPI00039FFB3B|nr:VTT domain-containing protein [Bacillus massiliigorillae]